MSGKHYNYNLKKALLNPQERFGYYLLPVISHLTYEFKIMKRLKCFITVYNPAYMDYPGSIVRRDYSIVCEILTSLNNPDSYLPFGFGGNQNSDFTTVIIVKILIWHVQL